MPRRMALATLLVLARVLENPSGRHYGLDLARRTNLPTGTIYPILARLERSGWLISDWERVSPGANRPPRRYYTLTGLGERSARSAVADAQHGLAPARPERVS